MRVTLAAVLLAAVACTRPAPPVAGRATDERPAAVASAPERRAEPQHAMAASAVPVAPRAPVADPVPSAPAPTPYDLAKDIAARKQKAKTELGKDVETRTVGEVYVLIGPRGFGGQAFAQSASLVEAAVAAYMNGRFKTAPKEAISVYLFGDASSYGAYCQKAFGEPCISIYGFYRHDVRAMVMNAGLGLGTLTHELVHPIVEADFPQAPTWINEGIASLFEAPMIPKRGEIHGGKNWRHPRLLRGLSSASERAEARLDRYFTMPDEQFREHHEDLHYAGARYVCQWLDQQNKLWPFYQAWRDGYDDDKTGEKAFAKVMGRAPAEVHDAWERWVRAL